MAVEILINHPFPRPTTPPSCGEISLETPLQKKKKKKKKKRTKENYVAYSE